ncbi:hypothetical protein QQ045_025537 [Rhodiola kirilowii]
MEDLRIEHLMLASSSSSQAPPPPPLCFFGAGGQLSISGMRNLFALGVDQQQTSSSSSFLISTEYFFTGELLAEHVSDDINLVVVVFVFVMVDVWLAIVANSSGCCCCFALEDLVVILDLVTAFLLVAMAQAAILNLCLHYFSKTSTARDKRENYKDYRK